MTAPGWRAARSCFAATRKWIKAPSSPRPPFRFYPTIPPDALAARILEAEHVIYPHAVRLIAEGNVNVFEESVFITGGSQLPPTAGTRSSNSLLLPKARAGRQIKMTYGRRNTPWHVHRIPTHRPHRKPPLRWSNAIAPTGIISPNAVALASCGDRRASASNADFSCASFDPFP